MRKLQFLLLMLKQLYICYYVICMTVPLNIRKDYYKPQQYHLKPPTENVS